MIGRSKRFWLILGLAALTVINVTAMVTTLVTRSDKECEFTDLGHPEKIRKQSARFLKKELGLDNDQQKAFKAYAREHREVARSFFREMMTIQQSIMAQMAAQNPDTTMLDSLSAETGRIHAALKKQTIRHFLQLKSITRPDQQEKVLKFFERLIERGMPGRSKHRKKHKGRNRRHPRDRGEL